MSEDLKAKLKKAETGFWKKTFRSCWNILPHSLRRQLVAMSGQSDLDF
ncbi:hypothetical protein [Leptospira licerasiae]|uniref:Uncharacterized protein n=1 Tax=Leptospira licerasiae str. MMD4847 TaxID=1049971 RepID=A0ABN0H9X3_9LEPT|nr:hypothetical protein [Leptospira licerasiae]EIE00222.1 hypothetical protein LEP1GSC185_2753 [Leptospira licerasiae serovar Varillal str. VAR 010]EJZ42141.1 hypothetical protein LEP1GSC178_0528 [Leptospira licerasiae str. MMD4847]